MPTVTFINLTLNINTDTKSKDLSQNASPLFNKSPPHSTIKLPRIQIFKTGFRRLSIFSKFWDDGNDKDGGIILFMQL